MGTVHGAGFPSPSPQEIAVGPLAELGGQQQILANHLWGLPHAPAQADEQVFGRGAGEYLDARGAP